MLPTEDKEARLTDEEIKQIQIETNNRISRFCNDCEGNFKQADIDGMYDEGNQALCDAQFAKLERLGYTRTNSECRK